jgi:hypothetical protein
MTLLSALEDFLQTLSAVPGQFSKLRYMASLRNLGRAYQHWGLSRVHGEKEAQQAIGEAHKKTFLEILRTPLPEVVKQAEKGSDFAFCKDAEKNWEPLLPNDLGGGSRRHFIALMKAVSAVLRHRGGSNR